jgi:hypothetical protein
MRKMSFALLALALALSLMALPAFAQIDTDGDGVPDDRDACPLNGDAGFGVAADGCPILVADSGSGASAGGADAAASAAVSCAGSLPPRLAVGDTGRIAERFSTLRRIPAGTGRNVIAVIRASQNLTFEVLEGPVCAGFGPLTWYRIRYSNGQEGWASESQRRSIYGNNRYWLEPVSGS